MSEIKITPLPQSSSQKDNKNGQYIPRRDFLKLGLYTLLGLGVGGTAVGRALAAHDQAPVNQGPVDLAAGAVRADATAAVVNNAEAAQPTNYLELFNAMSQMAENVAGIWKHPEASSIARPDFAPFLPATEAETIAFCKDLEAKNGNNGSGWGRGVFPRAIILPSDHPLDHVKDTRDAVKALGEQRGWGDITAWEKAWVYSMTLMGGLKDLQANNQVQVMSSGRMVDIDPVRLDNDQIALSVVNRGNPKMAVYVVPQNGEIHARLPQDTTESEVTMAFAQNKNHLNIKTDASDDDVAAIIVRGVATAPVTILAHYPTDDQGHYRTFVTETRLEPLTGNVTVHIPKEGYIGNFAPFITIRMPVVANNPKGETEVIFVPGSDVLQGNPKWAPKHRFTEADLKNGRPLP